MGLSFECLPFYLTSLQFISILFYKSAGLRQIGTSKNQSFLLDHLSSAALNAEGRGLFNLRVLLSQASPNVGTQGLPFSSRTRFLPPSPSLPTLNLSAQGPIRKKTQLMQESLLALFP